MTEPRTDSAAEARAHTVALAENATLWTLFATVTLFTAGQIAHFYELDALGIRALRLDVPWQDRVFEGGIAILNMVLKAIDQPSLAHLPWLLAAAIFAACLWWRRRPATRPRVRTALGALAACAYLAALILISMSWGRMLADLVRASTTTRDHFVFAPEAAARLPQALLTDNDARALRLVAATPDFFLVLSGDTRTAYRIATRDVELQETTRASAAPAAAGAGSAGGNNR